LLRGDVSAELMRELGLTKGINGISRIGAEAAFDMLGSDVESG